MNYEVAVFVNEDGETVERLAMLIEGHDVQMLRYDGNSEAMLVKVDETVKQMPLRWVNRFITTRLLVGVLLLTLAGCASPYRQAQPAAIAISTASPYPTVQPSATVDYFNTAVVAQQTADEARRVNAIVTGQAEQRNLELYQLTAQAEQRDFAQKAWTVTAALTSIPLTATQQAAVNTQIPLQNSLIAGQLTATKEAPTQIVAMIDSQNHALFAKANYSVRLFALVSFGIFCLGLLYFLLRLPQPAPATVYAEVEEETEEETNSAASRLGIKERHLAISLLQMRDVGSGVDLTERKWVESKKFTYDEFLGLRERWRNKGIIVRASDKQNATYEVDDWEAVRKIAEGTPSPTTFTSPVVQM